MPFLASLVARDARRHHDLVGDVAVNAEALLAVEDVAGAVLLRGRRHVGEIVARLPLDMREGEQRLAGRDLRQHVVARGFARAEPQEAAAENDGGEDTAPARARARTPPSRSWSRPARRRCRHAPRRTGARSGRDRRTASTARGSSRRSPSCISCAPRSRSAASSAARRCLSAGVVLPKVRSPCGLRTCPSLSSCPRAGAGIQ